MAVPFQTHAVSNPGKPRDPRAIPLDDTVVVQKPGDLVAEYIRLDDYVSAQTAKFTEHMRPAKARQEEIKNLFLAMSLEQSVESFKTEHGTAYKSTIVTPKIADREKYLDFVLDNWDEVGNEMMQLGAPQKDAVKNYIDAHEGQLPPGIEQTSFTRFNIRRS